MTPLARGAPSVPSKLRLASKCPLARSIAGKYSVRKPSSPVAICSWPRIGEAMRSPVTRSARTRPEIRPRCAASSRSSPLSCAGSAFSVTKPEPKVMTSVRPLASLWRMAASAQVDARFADEWRAAGGAGAGGGVHGSLVLDIGREPGGQRADRQVVRIGARPPAGFVPRSLRRTAARSCRACTAHRAEGLGARHHVHRRVELQVEIGGVVDEEVADGSPPQAVGKAALGRQMQAGAAGERVGPAMCSAVVPSIVALNCVSSRSSTVRREMAISACEVRWPRQSRSTLAANLSTLIVLFSMSLPRAMNLMTGAS